MSASVAVTTQAPPPLPAARVDRPAPVIDLQELSKWYGDVIGVNQVSLAIYPGVTGLLGPNGAGKSTLMKLITGQLRAGRGSVRVFGVSPWQNAEVFRRIGFCPDTDAFYEDLNGRDFVTLMGRLAGYSAGEARRRAENRMDRVGMSAHMARRIRGYSKGMRQRTKLAAAMVHEPDLIILDEPLNGLDPMGRIEMLNLFRALGAEGRTVLVSSHILHEIEALTKTIVLIHRGRVLAEGQIEDVRALIENQPLTLRIGSTQTREVGKVLAGLSSVSSLQFDTVAGTNIETLVARSNQPETVYEAIQAGVLKGDFSVQELSALDDNLDAVFQYLVKE